jgi:hypothetical protein
MGKLIYSMIVSAGWGISNKFEEKMKSMLYINNERKYYSDTLFEKS